MKPEAIEKTKQAKIRNNDFLTWLFVALLAWVNAFGHSYQFKVFGLNVYWYMPVMCVIIALGGLSFLISPQFARAKILGKHICVILLPILFPALWSHVTWIINMAGISEIRRGYVGIASLFLSFCAAASLVYVAGEKAGKWYLVSMLCANFAKIILTMKEGGVLPFLKEFVTLLVTFTAQTGKLMEQVELQGVTYGLGLYLIFYLMDREELKKNRWLFVFSILCFLIGLKRSALLALVPALVLGWMLLVVRKRQAEQDFFMKCLGIAFLFGALAYVGAVYYDLFSYLEKIGIDTNARQMIYDYYKPYFQFSPAFLGHGTGWVDDMRQQWSAAAAAAGELVFHTHNEYLRVYIELGMFGLLIWCYLRCNLQVSYAGKVLGQKGKIICLTMITYLAITYMVDVMGTDIYASTPWVAIVMSYHLTERENKVYEEMEKKNRGLSDDLV